MLKEFGASAANASKSYKMNKVAVCKRYEEHIETDEFKNSYIRSEQQACTQEAQKLLVAFKLARWLP